MPKAVEGQWTLDKRKSGYMTLASVAISFAGLFGFGWLCSLLGASNEFTITIKPGEDNSNTLLMLALIPFGFLGIYLALLVFHEWCHGLAARWVGAKPKYGAKFVTWFFPVFYVTAPHFMFNRKQYLAFALTPTIVVNVVGAALMLPPTPLRWMLVLPLGLHLGGCIGDWWMTCVIAKLPRETLFEDTPEGFLYRYEVPGAEDEPEKTA
jgi:hypothetical protein